MVLPRLRRPAMTSQAARRAEEAVWLAPPEGPPAPRLVEAARGTAADGVHPGCGLGAAGADLAAAGESAGLVISPASGAIVCSRERVSRRIGSSGISGVIVFCGSN